MSTVIPGHRLGRQGAVFSLCKKKKKLYYSSVKVDVKRCDEMIHFGAGGGGSDSVVRAVAFGSKGRWFEFLSGPAAVSLALTLKPE